MKIKAVWLVIADACVTLIGKGNAIQRPKPREAQGERGWWAFHQSHLGELFNGTIHGTDRDRQTRQIHKTRT